MVPDCINNIIGLSQSTCPCNEQDRPEGYNVSESGLFLDELEGLNLEMVKKAADCNRGGLWDLMQKAKDNAIKATFADIGASIAQSYSQRNSYVGLIGTGSYTRIIPNDGAYQGIGLNAGMVKGTKAKLKAVGLLLNQSGEFEVNVCANYKADPINETPIIINAVANQMTTVVLPEPIILELYREDLEGSMFANPLQYSILYQPGMAQPKDTQISCGCGNKDQEIGQYLNPRGVYGSDLSQLQMDSTVKFSESVYSYGMILDVELYCDSYGIICENYKRSQDWAMVLAHTVRYKAGELLIEYIQSTGNIDRYTTMNREYLWGKRSHFRLEYGSRIFGEGGIDKGEKLSGGWLSQNVNVAYSDCYKCSQRAGVSQGKILL